MSNELVNCQGGEHPLGFLLNVLRPRQCSFVYILCSSSSVLREELANYQVV